MKQVVICMLLLVITGTALCQQVHSFHRLESERLLRKGRKQQTSGLILTFGGGAALGVTFLTTLRMDPGLGTSAASRSKPHSPAAAYLLSGTAVAAGLILLCASDRNKAKANRVLYTLKWEQTSFPHAYGLAVYSYPCVGIRIKL